MDAEAIWEFYDVLEHWLNQTLMISNAPRRFAILRAMSISHPRC